MSPAEIVLAVAGAAWFALVVKVFRRAWKQRAMKPANPFPDTVCTYEERVRKRFRAKAGDRGMQP